MKISDYLIDSQNLNINQLQFIHVLTNYRVRAVNTLIDLLSYDDIRDLFSDHTSDLNKLRIENYNSFILMFEHREKEFRKLHASLNNADFRRLVFILMNIGQKRRDVIKCASIKHKYFTLEIAKSVLSQGKVTKRTAKPIILLSHQLNNKVLPLRDLQDYIKSNFKSEALEKYFGIKRLNLLNPKTGLIQLHTIKIKVNSYVKYGMPIIENLIIR